MGTPYDWSTIGLPCYRVGQAPPFLRTIAQLTELGLRPTGNRAAFVDSQHGDAALYLITETKLLNPDAWPLVKPDGARGGEPGRG
ncbi:hypothetical protein OG738_09700 [Amycolatopsis sp. NBC_01488]|uniref:hypothetical protein n=1 Tax=Amycolatopsis sp. NBC_01488 TaxID=2903563 RepID=UPI002E2D3C01|nr:hypothetical protein [Amycolatopsis sp. NBC_01488]